MLSKAYLFLLLPLAATSPTKPIKKCREYIIPVNTTSINYIWGLPELHNNYDTTAFSTDLARWDANNTFNPISGGASATADYRISGTFCSPVKGDSGTVLLATHGFGFDRSYWDPSIQPEKYSFVDHVISKGYSVFFYDRVGLGKSSLISGYVSQVSVQVAILEQLVSKIRTGKFSAKPKHIILVGHSFGSVVSNTLLRESPGMVDAAVLTGIGYDVPSTAVSFEAWQSRLARLESPAQWGKLDGGYVTWVDIFANVNTFFKAPFYNTRVVEYAEANKEPFSLMEAISLSIQNLTAPTFTGPVMVMSGEYDFIFCTGFCPGILEPGARKAFPSSRNLDVYVQPDSGHGINLSLNATGAFEVITGFLSKNGF